MIFIKDKSNITNLHCDLCENTCQCTKLVVEIKENYSFHQQNNEKLANVVWLSTYQEQHKDLIQKIHTCFPRAKNIIIKPFDHTKLRYNIIAKLEKWTINLR